MDRSFYILIVRISTSSTKYLPSSSSPPEKTYESTTQTIRIRSYQENSYGVEASTLVNIQFTKITSEVFTTEFETCSLQHDETNLLNSLY